MGSPYPDINMNSWVLCIVVFATCNVVRGDEYGSPRFINFDTTSSLSTNNNIPLKTSTDGLDYTTLAILGGIFLLAGVAAAGAYVPDFLNRNYLHRSAQSRKDDLTNSVLSSVENLSQEYDDLHYSDIDSDRLN